MKQYKSIKNRPIRVVAEDTSWRIEYSPADNEYSAVIKGSVGIIGYGRTKDEAMDWIYDYAAGQAEYRREAL